MKTTEQIIEHIQETIVQMLKHPKMFVACATDLEGRVLGDLGLLSFIKGKDDEQTYRIIIKQWRQFVYKHKGYNSALVISAELENNNELGENWEGLIALLDEFVKQCYQK